LNGTKAQTIEQIDDPILHDLWLKKEIIQDLSDALEMKRQDYASALYDALMRAEQKPGNANFTLKIKTVYENYLSENKLYNESESKLSGYRQALNECQNFLILLRQGRNPIPASWQEWNDNLRVVQNAGNALQ
jgi:hypothetical protein